MRRSKMLHLLGQVAKHKEVHRLGAPRGMKGPDEFERGDKVWYNMVNVRGAEYSIFLWQQANTKRCFI